MKIISLFAIQVLVGIASLPLMVFAEFYTTEINGHIVKCSLCPPGTHRVEHCEPSDPHSTLCRPCELGTGYTNKWNRALWCASCSSCTRRNYEDIKTNCTRTADTICECNAGRFLKDKNDEFCTLHIQCGPGLGVSKHGTSTSDNECTECISGQTFSGHFSATDMCTNLKICESYGLVMIQLGNITHDNVCPNITAQGGMINMSITAKPKEGLTSGIVTTKLPQNTPGATSSPIIPLDDGTNATGENPTPIILGTVLPLATLLCIAAFGIACYIRKRRKVPPDREQSTETGIIQVPPSNSQSTTELLNEEAQGLLGSTPVQNTSISTSSNRQFINDLGNSDSHPRGIAASSSSKTKGNYNTGEYRKKFKKMADDLEDKDVPGFKLLLSGHVGNKKDFKLAADNLSIFRLLEAESIIGEQNTSLLFHIFECMRLPKLQDLCKKTDSDGKCTKPKHVSELLYREAKKLSKNDIAGLVYLFKEEIGDQQLAKEITDNGDSILFFENLRQKYSTDKQFLSDLGKKTKLPVAASVNKFLHEHSGKCLECREQMLTSI